MALAAARLAELTVTHPGLAGRVDLITGDITRAGLGINPADEPSLEAVTEVWHLAAVYDLAVAESLAIRVNVEGTANVLAFCQTRANFDRLQYVSTCYVSGNHPGPYHESDLDTGQEFLNHYESTKFAAEVAVRAAMSAGLPATVYRPGIVVGDSTTGATQKYDGPYFLAAFMMRQPGPLAVIPAVADPAKVVFSLVPRDYVIAAMDELSVMPESAGQTYALVDPDPPTVRELVDRFARRLHKRVIWVPVPMRPTRMAIEHIPGVEKLVGFHAEGIDYFATATTYPATATLKALAGSSVSCPRFASYADTLLDYMISHPDVSSAAMV
jgi:thioester reductase-like protein